jgi:uncharacterized membrane protein HdeD (DUF308 family)
MAVMAVLVTFDGKKGLLMELENNIVPLKPSVLFVRGTIAAIFASVCVFATDISLFLFSLCAGAYLLADGIAAIFLQGAQERLSRSYGWTLFSGLCGLAAGLLTFLAPASSILALGLITGVWAMVLGALQIFGVLQTKTDPDMNQGLRLLLGFGGMISVLVGGSILSWPALNTVTLITLLVVNAVVSGVVYFLLGTELRKRVQKKTFVPNREREKRSA